MCGVEQFDILFIASSKEGSRLISKKLKRTLMKENTVRTFMLWISRGVSSSIENREDLEAEKKSF